LEYPSFLNLLVVPYTENESKLGDISLHTGPTSAPRTKTPLRSLQLSPYHLAGFKGPTSKRALLREKRGEKGREEGA